VSRPSDRPDSLRVSERLSDRLNRIEREVSENRDTRKQIRIVAAILTALSGGFGWAGNCAYQAYEHNDARLDAQERLLDTHKLNPAHDLSTDRLRRYDEQQADQEQRLRSLERWRQRRR